MENNLPELLARADELHAQIVAAGPLSPEAKRQLDYRFGLDWNYHSNVMEGSSLTRQDTRLIMLGQTPMKGKPLRDVLEMQGHNEVITKLLHMASGQLNLSEARIKEVHKAILRDPDPEKAAQAGQWKTVPNHLINYRGERFDFTAPADVPETMHRLLDRTKAAMEKIDQGKKDAPHPALLSFDFHREYVTIHPFHDGNGRTARIFSNILLMRFGFPPVIVKVGEKEAYNRYLAEVQAYGASPNLFNAFMAERLIRSQELVLDAIEGRSLEEEDDLDKRLALLDMELAARDPRQDIQLVLNRKTLGQMLEGWIFPLFEKAIPKAQKFNKYFVGTQHMLSIHGIGHFQFANEAASTVIKNVRQQWEADQERRIDSHEKITVALILHYGTFKHSGKSTFGCQYQLEVDVEHHTYSVYVDDFNRQKTRNKQLFEERLLHEPLPEMKQREVVGRLSTSIMEHLEYWVEQGGSPPAEPTITS